MVVARYWILVLDSGYLPAGSMAGWILVFQVWSYEFEVPKVKKGGILI